MRDSRLGLRINMLIYMINISIVPVCGQAAEPIVAQESIQFDASQSKTAFLSQLPQNVSLHYVDHLAALYKDNGMQPMWREPQAVQQFQQQLAEVGLSGIQPQFIQWIQLLTDPAIHGLARNMVLSDALLGYLYFIAEVKANQDAWLYNEKNTSFLLEDPSVTQVKRWQLSVQEGSLTVFPVVGS